MSGENLLELKEQARQKIEGEMEGFDSPVSQIGMICLSWLDYADNAAELILTNGKTLKGAWNSIYEHASKVQKNGAACVEPAKSFELVLEYFGQPDPQGIIEGGLMYKAMTDAAARFKPYGVEAPAPPAAIPSNPQPAAILPKPAKSALDALNLEDFGL